MPRLQNNALVMQIMAIRLLRSRLYFHMEYHPDKNKQRETNSVILLHILSLLSIYSYLTYEDQA